MGCGTSSSRRRAHGVVLSPPLALSSDSPRAFDRTRLSSPVLVASSKSPILQNGEQAGGVAVIVQLVDFGVRALRVLRCVFETGCMDWQLLSRIVGLNRSFSKKSFWEQNIPLPDALAVHRPFRLLSFGLAALEETAQQQPTLFSLSISSVAEISFPIGGGKEVSEIQVACLIKKAKNLQALHIGDLATKKARAMLLSSTDSSFPLLVALKIGAIGGHIKSSLKGLASSLVLKQLLLLDLHKVDSLLLSDATHIVAAGKNLRSLTITSCVRMRHQSSIDSEESKRELLGFLLALPSSLKELDLSFSMETSNFMLQGLVTRCDTLAFSVFKCTRVSPNPPLLFFPTCTETYSSPWDVLDDSSSRLDNRFWRLFVETYTSKPELPQLLFIDDVFAELADVPEETRFASFPPPPRAIDGEPFFAPRHLNARLFDYKKQTKKRRALLAMSACCETRQAFSCI